MSTDGNNQDTTPAMKSSRIAGLHRLSVDRRIAEVAEFGDLCRDGLSDDLRSGGLTVSQADNMIENAVGLIALPVGVAPNFQIDGVDYLLPLAIEEPSVVAACSKSAKLLRDGGGIATTATESLMIGQIQLLDVPDLDSAAGAIEARATELLAGANETQPRLLARGGGARRLETRRFAETSVGSMLVVHLIVDVCDAMGANLVNTMAEHLAPRIAELTGARIGLRILSNLCSERMVTASGCVPYAALEHPKLGLSGRDVAQRVEEASVFAEVDPYRATTHNKGIMNGIDAFLIATGQDWRAVEAGAHAYAARHGRYTALATWKAREDGLHGQLELPLSVGTVGGVVKVHPVAKRCLQLTGAVTARHLARLAAAAGLAQNLGAILALATEGIQRGHMALHARNLAVAAGARASQVAAVTAEMLRLGQINETSAAAALARHRRAERQPLDPRPTAEL